ncbi:MAG: hypothetical protein V1882_11015 [Candidatus Omnitrophota bacterium]
MEDITKNETEQGKASERAAGAELVELQARDIAMFRFMNEQGYLAHSHLKSAFWQTCSEEAGACHHRLDKLVAAGYLAKETGVKKKLSVYRLREKGFGELLRRGLRNGTSLFKLNGYHRTNMDHDLKVTNLRIFFRRHGLDGWTSERVLRQRDYYLHVPDGLLTVYEERIAIELENSTKGRKRYEALFKNYEASKEYSRVFMVLNTEIMDWVIDLEYDPAKIWFVEYKTLFREGEKAIFRNKADTFILSQIL